MATSILDDKKDPKIRMKIQTRFLEGSVDILDRITIKWESVNGNDEPILIWNESNWNDNNWAYPSGAITWSEKDFFIVGITHSYSRDISEYILKEV